jgi:Fic family protein
MAALPPLAEELVDFARRHGRLTIGGAVEVTGANRNTVKNHLKKLVESGRLAQCGRGRGTWYEVRNGT